MDVGIGLPNAVEGATGAQLVERLAAAAAVTERIGLATTVLLGPLRSNAVARSLLRLAGRGDRKRHRR